MNQTKLSTGPLHDSNGHLIEAGYATSELRSYDRTAIKAPWYRIKEWDYYGLFGEDYGLGLVVADNAYMGLLSVTWFDFQKRRQIDLAHILPLSRGRLHMPASADSGDVEIARNGLEMSFRHASAGRNTIVNAPDFNGGQGLYADLRLEQPPMDRMVIATPFPHDRRAFYYNQKVNCLQVQGDIKIGSETYSFRPETHFGVLDWGRGVWAYDNLWYWGSASGKVGDRLVGFNIGYGFGDTSAASENMFFLDGVAHKLDEVRFHIPNEGHANAEWQFSSNDGRFEMLFTPVYNRHDKTDLLVLRSETNQTFGYFSGHVILDDGSRFDVPRIFGFAEEVHNRW